jgi:hypothetical protein
VDEPSADLVSLGGFGFPVAASAGAEERAAGIAAQASSAFDWLCERLGWRPAVRVTVADEDHWSGVAVVPVYGVPQTWGDHTIVAAGRAPLFDELAGFLTSPGVGGAPHEGLAAAYGDPPDLTAFFDLQVVHELAHLFGEQATLRPAPLWVDELRCNLAMVGFVAERRPELLPVLRAAPRASAGVPLDRVAETALERMEAAAGAGPLDFGWYQLRLTDLAVHLWQTGEVGLDVALYRLLRAEAGVEQPTAVTLDEVRALSPALSAAVDRWPAVHP